MALDFPGTDGEVRLLSDDSRARATHPNRTPSTRFLVIPSLDQMLNIGQPLIGRIPHCLSRSV